MTLRASLSAPLLAVVLSAFAAQNVAFISGVWQGDANYDANGKFSDCLMTAQADSGILIGFVISKHFEWGLVLADETRKFKVGETEAVVLLVDQRDPIPAIAKVVDVHGIVIPLEDSDPVIDALRGLIVPQSTIVTPNAPEARRLAEDDLEDEELDLASCAQRLLAMGCDYVLVTGTHEPGAEVVNTLYAEQGIVRADRWPRLAGSYHGSGCTLASAIAAALANGLDMPEAVRDAQEYTWQALASGLRLGMGQLLPDRFFWAREVGGQEDEAAA